QVRCCRSSSASLGPKAVRKQKPPKGSAEHHQAPMIDFFFPQKAKSLLARRSMSKHRAECCQQHRLAVWSWCKRSTYTVLGCNASPLSLGKSDRSSCHEPRSDLATCHRIAGREAAPGLPSESNCPRH